AVFYGLLHLFTTPRPTAFVMGWWTGLAAFFYARIAWMCLESLDGRYRVGYWLLALLLGLTGTVGYPLIGSTTNDWPAAALVLAGLCWMLRGSDEEGTEARFFALGGVLLGAASGLKLTSAMYAVGAAAAVVLHRRPTETLRPALAYGAGVIVGFALTAGPW